MLNIGYTPDIEKQRRGMVESVLNEAKPLIVLRCQTGVLLATPNPSSIRKIREVFPDIVGGIVGEISDLDQCFHWLVNLSHWRQLQYSKQDVKALPLALAIVKEISSVFGNITIRPLRIELVLVSAGLDASILTVSYDGSIREDKNFTVLGSKSNKKIIEEKLNSLKFPLSEERAHQISKELLGEKLETKFLKEVKEE